MNSNLKVVVCFIISLIFVTIFIFNKQVSEISKVIKQNQISFSNADIGEIRQNLNYLNSELKSFKEKFSQLQEHQNELLSNFKMINDEKEIDEENYSVRIEKSTDEDEIKKHLKVYNLSQENTNQFDCVKSAEIIVSTTICLHDLTNDVFVSGSIKKEGVWERSLVDLFMKILKANPDFQVLDIGSQLGQFSLFASKLGRTCIAVEPFYNNYIRLHKSAQLAQVTDKIILITNGVSDKRGEKKKLHMNHQNIGGQGINEQADLSQMNEEQLKNDKYVLTTIFLDDLITVLPNNFKNAIMKIDIEGHEIKAMRRASKLFKTVKIHAVFMEWLGKTDESQFPDAYLNELLDFMESTGLVLKNPSTMQLLKRKDMRSWPADIIWVRPDLSF
jgi:FkbM family methyltransferase